MRLRDIKGTAGNLVSGAVLDDVELFEVKSLLLLAMEIRQELSSLKITTVEVSPLCELVVRILDPDGQKVPSFHIYDSYSEDLAKARSRMRIEKDESDTLLRHIQELEDAIRKRLSEELRIYANVVWLTLEGLAEIDVLLAQSLQIKDMGLVFPENADDPSVNPKPQYTNKTPAGAVADNAAAIHPYGLMTKYKKMFHPQVKELLREKGRDFQPVDISFGGGPVTIIGANMGGKTVALKTVGLCQLLFQFGFGIPADRAVIGVKKGVLFCIGEEDLSERGLSSFASEVVCLGRIIAAGRENGCLLALVDEPARATNPVEGTALVEAFIRIMAGTGTDLILTTHYKLEGTPGKKYRVKGLVNGQMDYELVKTDDSTIPHEAVNIAESLGADPQWIALTKNILNNYE